MRGLVCFVNWLTQVVLIQRYSTKHWVKKKGSKITLFIEDNFYNDAVKWLETRNEDSKDRTNLTSQDVAIIKRKGWKLEGSKILSKNGKEKCSKM